MPFPSLTDVDAAVRASWGPDTCDPVDLDEWTPDNPARGQCGVTTLVRHDPFGGDIARTEVHDGEYRQDSHLWLRTAGGLQLDLTREQFGATEVVGDPEFFARPNYTRPTRCAEQYELLRRRLFERLGIHPPT